MSTREKLVRQFVILLVLLFLPQKSWSLCAYRSKVNLIPEVFNYHSSWGCYSFIRPDLFSGYPLQAQACNITINGENYDDVPALIFNNVCVPFHFTNDRIRTAAESTFKYKSTVDRWIQCSLDAQDCCTNIMNNNTRKANYCPPVWDGWSCFKSNPTDETYEQVCSSYAYAGEPPRCHHFSYKQCYENGTWKETTDYSRCDITPQLKFRTNWHISILALSILFCTPAALALITLNSQKLSIIRNLVFAIILRNLFVILSKSIIIMDELVSIQNTVMSQNKWPCKFLTFLEKLLGNTVFACMILEGIYLHQLLTNAFRSRQSGGVKMMPFNIACAILVVGSAISWASVMATHYDENCWQVTEGTDYTWILTAPRLLMLLVNLVLLVHIIWALWNAFRSKDDENRAALRTVKAAVICLPLFGMPFFFVILHPNTDSCSLEQFYYVMDYSIDALQGVFIVIFHCYRERDVKRVITSLFDVLRNTQTDSIPERRATMKSNLENTENGTPRPTDQCPEYPTISTEQQLVLSRDDGTKKHTPDILNDMTGCQNCEEYNINRTDDPSEIKLDPKILFKNRSDGVVLLDPNERKY